MLPRDIVEANGSIVNTEKIGTPTNYEKAAIQPVSFMAYI